MEALYGTHPLGETAELVAELHHVSREEQDAFALESQRRWAAAQAAGRFAAELVAPSTCRLARGATKRFEIDEHPRPETTAADLAALAPVFRKSGGTVTAGNSSGINDGAAALVLASAEGLKRLGRPAAGARRRLGRGRRRAEAHGAGAHPGHAEAAGPGRSERQATWTSSS